VKGCETAYVLVGLEYKLAIWRQTWPKLMRNVIKTCSHSGARLVFLDNIYMLSDGSMPHMTEDSPMEPPSEKGKIRAEVDRIILDAVKAGSIQACIARAADFYGYMTPYKSLLLDLVIRKMAVGKKPQWFYTISKKHAFTYVPDLAKGLLLLGKDPAAMNQVWNMPTAPALTLDEIISTLNLELGTRLKPAVYSESVMKLVRLFIPALKEMKELKYQMVQDYVLDSSKFESHFSFTPKSMQEGLREVLRQIKAEAGPGATDH
jgi:nucleoside-diphosphate-sugar epimerase